MKSFSTCFVRRQAGGEIESDDSDEYQTPSERGDIYKFGLSEIPLVDFKAALRYVRGYGLLRDRIAFCNLDVP